MAPIKTEPKITAIREVLNPQTKNLTSNGTPFCKAKIVIPKIIKKVKINGKYIFYPPFGKKYFLKYLSLLVFYITFYQKKSTHLNKPDRLRWIN
jgi:hypothetical protein